MADNQLYMLMNTLRAGERENLNELDWAQRGERGIEQNEQVFACQHWWRVLQPLLGIIIIIVVALLLCVYVMRNGNLFKHLAASPWEIIKINKVCVALFSFLHSIAQYNICICTNEWFFVRHYTKYMNANATAVDGGSHIFCVAATAAAAFHLLLCSFYNFNSIQFILHWFAVSPLLRKRHINLIDWNLSVLLLLFFCRPPKKHLYETNRMKWHKNETERIDQSLKN